MKCVVLSGGSGTRLWPASRIKHPKQFLRLGQLSLQAETLKRLSSFGELVVVSSADLKALNEADTEPFRCQNLYEPLRKNTATAVAFAVSELRASGPETVVGIFPADHHIQDPEAFAKTLREALRYLESSSKEKDTIVTLGVLPTHPSSAYGYIEVQDPKMGSGTGLKHRGGPDTEEWGGASKRFGLRFVEKPSKDLAQQWISTGNYFWNAGIFLAKVSVFEKLFQIYAPQLHADFFATDGLKGDLFDRYQRQLPVSFDVAVMEKLNLDEISLVCFPLDCGWSDVGSWEAISQIPSVGQPVLELGLASTLFVHGEPRKLYVNAGVTDVIVVDTPDAMIIGRPGQMDLVKGLADKLPGDKRLETHSLVSVLPPEKDNRPWGSYQVLHNDRDCKVKRIEVLPLQRLSYQNHQHREEHWLVVSGEGIVTLEGIEQKVTAGGSVHIPKQAKHRIANTSPNSKLVFIEVQLGESFAESDIQRFEDDYQR